MSSVFADTPTSDDDAIVRAERTIPWVLGVSFSGAERDRFHDALLEDLRASTPEKIASTRAQLVEMERWMSLEPEQRELLRLAARQKMLFAARREPASKINQLLIAAYAEAHRPLVAGEPPLTREISDGIVDLMAFVLKEATGKHEETPAKVREDAAGALAKRWSAISAVERQQLSNVPLLVAALRYRWAHMPEADRETARAGWRRQLPSPTPSKPTTAQDMTPAQFKLGMMMESRRHNMVMGILGNIAADTPLTTNLILDAGGNVRRK
jgi:hypothetical protein